MWDLRKSCVQITLPLVEKVDIKYFIGFKLAVVL